MGMDVYGKNATNEMGDYFRNNIWWWRPLWDYCCQEAPELCGGVQGHDNSGDGLDEAGSEELANILYEQLQNGNTNKYYTVFYEEMKELPLTPCDTCNATGTRTDKVAIEYGMHDKKLSDEMATLVGREFGWCNACDGLGKTKPFLSNYHFSVENVQEFVLFLRSCGGFEIC